MSFPFKSKDLLYISLLTFYILFNVLQWSDYQECSAPIHLFLIAARCILLFLVISLVFLKSPTMSSRSKSFINFLIHVVLNPFCLYLAVQGFIWQMKNMTKTPDCIPNIGHDISVFAWITGIFCVAGILSYLNVLKAYKYWKVVQFRRRWNRINLTGNPEEINEFLYGTPAEISQKAGLETADIDKLPINEYSLSLQNILKANHSETCPICFEDFKDGDALTALPKCEHRFHPQCINGWLVKSPLCPLCRGNVRNNLYMETIEQIEQTV